MHEYTQITNQTLKIKFKLIYYKIKRVYINGFGLGKKHYIQNITVLHFDELTWIKAVCLQKV